jgi:hypothetical protein
LRGQTLIHQSIQFRPTVGNVVLGLIHFGRFRK